MQKKNLRKRDLYLKQMIAFQDTEMIKVMTGIRRCGKSSLMKLMAEHLRESGVTEDQILEMNFESMSIPEMDARGFYEYVKSHICPDKRTYLFFDEVQKVPGWENAVNSFRVDFDCDIYITGSNAFLAASDLATLFVGRTYSIEVYPFSLAEFMDYFGYQDRHDALRRYLREGGMAGSYDYRTLTDKYNYLQEIYDTLIVRDIEQKHNLKNKAAMEQLSDFLMDNISRLTSARNIVNALAANGTEISHKTIGEYLKYLRAAYAFYRVRRYDIKGKRYLSSVDKFYLVDHAFRYAKLGTKTPDFGSAYENIVAIELLRRGYEVYVGTMRRSEIDFVAIKNGSRQYIQVAYLVDDEATMRREVAPLMDIPGGYQKLLIAGTRQPELEYEGIRILDLADWLLDLADWLLDEE